MGPGHNHSPSRITRAFALGIGLNALFVVVEVASGFWFGSLSLLTDAGHNLGDVGSLILGLIAAGLAGKKPTGDFTYGLRKGTVLAGLVNAVILLISIGAISYAAVARLSHPVPVRGEGIATVALLGIAVNSSTALLFFRDRNHDLNARSAYLHLVTDAAISLGVVVAGVVIYFTGWQWCDPLVSLLVSLAILYSAWGLLRDALRLALDGVPRELDLGEVRSYLMSLKNVQDVHDLHVWALSTTETALTAHIVMPEPATNLFFNHVNEHLFHEFRISHATLQVELEGANQCEQRC